MTEYTLRGAAVIGDALVSDAAVCVKDGRIVYAGDADKSSVIGEIFSGDVIMPGFIDIHCHAAGDIWFYDDPAAVCDFHRAHGTTTICATLYRDLGIDGMLAAINVIRDAMKKYPMICGVHLEGPYLNPKYGAMVSDAAVVCKKDEYMPLIDSGIVRQVTVAPEVEGSIEFIRALRKKGIVASIGHSAASPEEVSAAVAAGAGNVTHLFDATGAAFSPTRWDGTIETDFSFAALCEDGLTYEIICDRDGIHVRPEMVRLAVKTVGTDNIIAVTDACGGGGEGDDVNFVDGELSGSKLTMNKAAKNFAALGYDLPTVSKFCSANPARLLGLDSETGTIEVGKAADLVVLNKSFDVLYTFTKNDN